MTNSKMYCSRLQIASNYLTNDVLELTGGHKMIYTTCHNTFNQSLIIATVLMTVTSHTIIMLYDA